MVRRLNATSGFYNCGNEKRFVNIDTTTAFVRETCQPELMIHIGGEYEIIFILQKRVQIQIGFSERRIITVIVNMPAPVTPFFFLSRKRVKTGGIHIP